ncbi:MAG: cytochrome c oxidase subunit 4 [Candidatus Nanopelagicales bacterium]
MKIGGWLFFWGAAFYFAVGTIYYFFTKEPVGSTAILLTGGLSLLIAFYVLFTNKRIGYQPEDNYEGQISEAESDYGFYSPQSWWPMLVAGAAAITFVGFVVTPWIFVLGLGFVIFSVTGWLFEYWKFERNEPVRH